MERSSTGWNRYPPNNTKDNVNSTHLEQYRAALKEGIETAVRVEPGVLTLFAVYDKEHPTHVAV
jgi:hypothetical protein